MKKLIFLFLSVLFLLGCKEKKAVWQPKVLILMDTTKQSPEVNEDRLYHVNNLLVACEKEGISSKLIFGRELKPEFSAWEETYYLEDQESFAMFMQNKNGQVGVEKVFGTDVDLLLVIKNFFDSETVQ